MLLLSLFDFVRAKFDYSMDSAHSKSGGNDDKHDNDTDNVDDNNHDNADDTGLGTNIGGSSNHSFYAAGTNAHINGKEAAVSSFKDPVMASWVQEHSYVPPKSLEDVAEMMHHLAEDLAQERRLRKQAEQRAARKDMELRQMLRHLINTTTSVNKSIKKLNGEQAPEEAASSSWEASAPASAALQAHRENSRQRSSSKEHSDYVSPYSKQMYSGISGRRHRSQRGSRVRVKVRGKKLGRTGGMASFRQQMGLSGALPKKETVYDRLHRNGRR